jgi:hypothetical protein
MFYAITRQERDTMTDRLSTQAYESAASYLTTQGRALERALFAYETTGAPLADVYAALAAYQNADGGFGHALEPDVRLIASSMICTTIAFQHFRELGTPADQPLVSAACAFLKASYDADQRNWSNVPPFVDDAPHAPWWTFRDQVRTEFANPRAEIVGYLYDYPQHFDTAWRDSLAQAALDHLRTYNDEIEMHDLLCYVRLLETRALPDAIRHPLLDQLRGLVAHSVARDPKQWQAYGLQPVAVATTPGSPFADLMGDALDVNLDFVIASQGADGAWHPNFSWGGEHPEVWAQAEREWSSVLTLANLRLLRAFGRID